MSVEHVPLNWRMEGQRYALRGRAKLTQTEFERLQADGATFSQLLDCSRDQLEKLFPDMTAPDEAFVFPHMLLQEAAK